MVLSICSPMLPKFYTLLGAFGWKLCTTQLSCSSSCFWSLQIFYQQAEKTNSITASSPHLALLCPAKEQAGEILDLFSTLTLHQLQSWRAGRKQSSFQVWYPDAQLIRTSGLKYLESPGNHLCVAETPTFWILSHLAGMESGVSMFTPTQFISTSGNYLE